MEKSLIKNLYKKAGETPLERLNRFKDENPEFKDMSLTYAGRLDPLAEGVLLVLGGEAIKQKEEFLSLSKTYYFEILWGFETDTFDFLGKIENFLRNEIKIDQDKLQKALLKIKSLEKMSYPPFSSKTVEGEPLFKLAREGELKEGFNLPERSVKIFSIENIENFEVSKNEAEKIIREKISLVKGDFRQEEILSLWRKNLESLETKSLKLSSFRATVSGGVYIRRIADILGRELGCGAICFKIIREKVGDFSIDSAQR